MQLNNRHSFHGVNSVMQELERAQARLSVLENTLEDLLGEVDARWSQAEALAERIAEGKNLA